MFNTDWNVVIETLNIFWKGMLAIALVLVVIIIVTIILNKIDDAIRAKKEKTISNETANE